MAIKLSKLKHRIVGLLIILLPFKSSLKKFLLRHKFYISNTFFKECPKVLYIENWEVTHVTCDVLPHIVYQHKEKILSNSQNKVLFLIEREQNVSTGFKVETHIENVPGPFDPAIGIRQQVVTEKIELTKPVVTQFLFIAKGYIFRSYDSKLVNNLDSYGEILKFKEEPVEVFGKFRTRIVKFYLGESFRKRF